MHTTERPAAGRRTPGASPLYGLYVLSLAASLVGNLVIRLGARGGWLPEAGQLTLAIIATAPLVVCAALFWRMLRRDLDELLQRIVLEGLAFAMVLFIPIATLYVNLRAAGIWTPQLDAPDILLTPALLVAMGIVLANRRYQ